jgi:hypothetical protein
MHPLILTGVQAKTFLLDIVLTVCRYSSTVMHKGQPRRGYTVLVMGPEAMSARCTPRQELAAQELLQQLRQNLAQWEKQGKLHGSVEIEGVGQDTPGAISTGCLPLDRRLPAGGWLPGQLVEWFAEGPGCGTEWFVLQAARARLACQAAGDAQRKERGVWVVMDRDAHFYPPAVLSYGMDLRQLVVVRPQSGADELWALDQVLRCPVVALVLAWLPRLTSREFRRLQLAAEAGGVIGCLIRPASAQHEPSWADVQIALRPLAAKKHPATHLPKTRCWHIEILRCRGGRAGQAFHVELDENSGCMRELV